MAPSVAQEILHLHVPPEPAQVATMRSFVGAVGRHVGCEDEELEDLRLVVTEACAQALDEGVAPDGFELRAWIDDEVLVLELGPAPAFETAGSPDPLDPASGERRWELVSALFPSVEIRSGEAASVLRIAVPFAG